MVAPLVLAPLIAGGALSSVYHVGKAVETSRYWSDYQRNTGCAPRYPFRVGRYDYIRNVGSSMAVFGFARGFGGYVPTRMPNDLMSMYR